jgi:hypothetical protein
MAHTLLKHLRGLTGLSQDDLGDIAQVDAHYICTGERHGFLFDGQRDRLSEALGWNGDAGLLTEDVDSIDDLEAQLDRSKIAVLAERAREFREQRSHRGPRAHGAKGMPSR